MKIYKIIWETRYDMEIEAKNKEEAKRKWYDIMELEDDIRRFEDEDTHFEIVEKN